MKVTVVGAGAGGAAAVAEFTQAGHEVRLWNRSAETLSAFQRAGGVEYEGVLGTGIARPAAITTDLRAALAGTDAVVCALPTFSHAPVARLLAANGLPASVPVILNPGHTGGALEFRTTYRDTGKPVPPIAELSTLTYVARKYAPQRVTITGHAKAVRAACLAGGAAALEAARSLYRSATPVRDVLETGLANVNMVLHPPGAVLAAAWVEARAGDFTFYVDAMTPGVARVMKALDDERRGVGRAFGLDLPNLIEEMQRIGTVDASVSDTEHFARAIAGGEANSRIKAPGSLEHRYYLEDFAHGLLPFIEFARIANVAVPTANALFALAGTLVGVRYEDKGRTAKAMGIEGLDRQALLAAVRP
jgi:opine dehydrogenase